MMSQTAMITFRDRHEAYRIDALSVDPLLGETDSFGEADRVAEPVSLSHPAHVNAVDADASMVVTGADDGVVRIFDFGSDLWRPPAPPSPKLCGQTSLVSSASSTCVLMARPGRNKVSVGNRRQTWGTCALAVLARANLMLRQSQAEDRQAPAQSDPRSLAWMNVDEIYKCMLEWELQPVRYGPLAPVLSAHNELGLSYSSLLFTHTLALTLIRSLPFVTVKDLRQSIPSTLRY